MKNFSFLVITALALTLVACGNKNESGSNSGKHFSSDPYKVQTITGYINTQQPIFEVGSTTYHIVDQQSQQVITRAYQLAQQQGIIKPNVIRYKANLTGYVMNANQQPQGYPNQYPSQYPTPSTTANQLMVSQAVFTR